MWRGDIDRARTLLGELLALAEERGEEWSELVFTLHQFELAARVGDWTLAATLRDRLAVAGRFFDRPAIAVRARITVGAVTGDRASVRDGLRFSGDPMLSMIEWHILEIWRVPASPLCWPGGRSRGGPAAVGRRLDRDRRAEEPGRVPVRVANLIEALVRSDHLDAARTELDYLDALAREQDNPGALAVAERARGILLAALRADDDAEAAYRLSIARCRTLGLRFDEARATAALGDLKRRKPALPRSARAVDGGGRVLRGAGRDRTRGDGPGRSGADRRPTAPSASPHRRDGGRTRSGRGDESPGREPAAHRYRHRRGAPDPESTRRSASSPAVNWSATWSSCRRPSPGRRPPAKSAARCAESAYYL